MSSAKEPGKGAAEDEDETEPMDEMLAADDAAEEVGEPGGDAAMDSDQGDGDEDEDEEAEAEVELHNDAVAYFDEARDSLFAIAQHPTRPTLVAVGGSAGPGDDAPGAGWLVDTAAAPRPAALASAAALDGHADSVSALCWTLPRGDVLVSGGLDGRLRAWAVDVAVAPLAEAREVDEVNWLAACPAPTPDGGSAVALGASDGSVWVYIVDASAAEPLRIARSYFVHTASCTAGAWTADGRLLATVAEDSSLHVWDVWGGGADGAAAAAVSRTAADQRFAVDGGLYSVAVDPRGAFVAVGGAAGAVRVVSLPRPAAPAAEAAASGGGGGGQLLASLRAGTESVEALAVGAVAATASSPPATLLAAGSVDGSVVVFDAARRFAARRHLPAAHVDHAVVGLGFVPASWLLTSCGMDGVVRRWDLRAPDGAPPLREWRGHAAGVLGFVQGPAGERVVTAGDDGLVLVFEA